MSEEVRMRREFCEGRRRKGEAGPHAWWRLVCGGCHDRGDCILKRGVGQN